MAEWLNPRARLNKEPFEPFEFEFDDGPPLWRCGGGGAPPSFGNRPDTAAAAAAVVVAVVLMLLVLLTSVFAEVVVRTSGVSTCVEKRRESIDRPGT